MRISDWSSDVWSSDLHIACDIHRIAEYCRANQIALIEDCAHAVGAEWNGVKPGAFGDAGIFSLYATKTIRSEEHTSELQSLMRISYAVFCLKKKKKTRETYTTQNSE